MANDSDPIERNTTEARAGATPHMTRVILPVSLVLVIVAFVLVYFLA
jgi:hypothetical protein